MSDTESVDSHSFPGERVANARKPTAVVCALAFTLILSAGLSFLGYHYLQLSSEYRMRNFAHLNAVNKSLDVLSESPILRTEAIEKVSNEVSIAREQAVWCIENLSLMEEALFKRLGGTEALEICASDIVHADAAKALLDRIAARETLQATGADSAFSLALLLRETLLTMRRESEAFHPHVNVMEARLSRLIHYGTAFGTLSLLALLAFLSRALLSNWRLTLEQAREIRKFHMRFAAAINASRDGFALMDEEGFLITSNKIFRRLASPDEKTVKPGVNIATIFRRAVLGNHYANVPPDAHAEFIRRNVDWMRSETPEKRFELTGDRHIVVKIDKTKAGDHVIVVNDVTEAHRNNQRLTEHMNLLVTANREIEFRSLHDPLTNLANRRFLDERIGEQGDTPLTMLHLDLDRFKQINDLMGHAAGDVVLKHVAGILQNSARTGDLVARVGGDEFAILCRPGTSQERARQTAESILEKFQQPLLYEGKPCNVGTSIGIAMAAKGESDELLNMADAALYEAKQQGKGRICLFTDELCARIKKDRALTQDFQSALEAGQFVPFYQSQHCAQDWSIVGVEVLARWDHPELGVLAPSRFLHIARQLGLENELDAVIFDRAMSDIEAMDDAGAILKSVSFNVSAGRILDPKFSETARTRIPAPRDRFGFEVLETVSVEDLGAPLRFAIDSLRDLGFRIEIDDFGSGHASIKSVLELSPHALKIDRALIKPMGESEQAKRMITSIIEIGRALGVKITAEGVETEQHARLLGAMGCHTLQGYFFSRPTSLEALKTQLVDNQAAKRRAMGKKP
jgi:diguanylate cyclase (GGDEF)-like protein